MISANRHGVRDDFIFSFVIGAAFFALLLATPAIPGGDDGYRHARLAFRLVRDPGATMADPWALLYFWPKPVDAWFGYHLFLAPLTLALAPITSIKLLTAIIFGCISFTLLAILRDFRAPWRYAWAVLALAGSGASLYRSCLCRPFLFSVLLVLLAALFTLREKPLATGIVSAAHALSYSMFFLVALAPVAWLAVRMIPWGKFAAGNQGPAPRGPALRVACACLAGMAAGLLANPYFPENVRFDLTVAIAGPLTAGVQHAVKVGRELESFHADVAVASLPILALWVFALAATAGKSLTAESKVYLILSAVTLAASVRVVRTFDYFVPAAAVFSATVLSPAKRPSWKGLYAVCALLGGLLCGLHALAVYNKLATDAAPDHFQGGAGYLRAHGRGALVFNTQWQQYQFLYFWNPDSTYVTGIEPTLMFLEDQRKYWLWRHIADDATATCGAPRCDAANSKDINQATAEFGARFILTEHGKTPRVERALRNDPSLKEVYRDPNVSIFASPAS